MNRRLKPSEVNRLLAQRAHRFRPPPTRWGRFRRGVGSKILVWGTAITSISIVVAMFYNMCNTESVRTALVREGYRNIETSLEPSFFVCGHGTFGHKVTAIDPQGRPFERTACCNVFNRCTIEP